MRKALASEIVSNHITLNVILALTLGIGLLGFRPVAAAPETSRSMRIGVIGADSLGGTVGRVLVKAGHEVKFSSRHPEELLAMTRELGPRASVGTPREAAIRHGAAVCRTV